MTHKIYLIKHLDTGMGYVGITGDELGKRWYQHLHDPASAVYKALRAEGHRMTMEHIAEYEDRAEALDAEQMYIQIYNTAAPFGWNRRVKPKPKPKNWIACKMTASFKYDWMGSILLCPQCKCEYTHQWSYEIYNRHEDDKNGYHFSVNWDESTLDDDMTKNPSERRHGIRINYSCQNCHFRDEDKEYPPNYELLIFQHKGQTIFETLYYREDK